MIWPLTENVADLWLTLTTSCFREGYAGAELKELCWSVTAEPGSAPRPPLFRCGLELFTGYKMMQFFFFPERTHPPPPGSTRRPRFSGRHADQTRCHGGRPHPGKAPPRSLPACTHRPAQCLPPSRFRTDSSWELRNAKDAATYSSLPLPRGGSGV